MNKETQSIPFSFSRSPFNFPLICSCSTLAVFPLFIITISLDTFFSLPSGCRTFGLSCCCFYTQDRSMNPGAFSNSGPLSWAMYLMRKGRTGSGLFGKANSSSIKTAMALLFLEYFALTELLYLACGFLSTLTAAAASLPCNEYRVFLLALLKKGFF